MMISPSHLSFEDFFSSPNTRATNALMTITESTVQSYLSRARSERFDFGRKSCARNRRCPRLKPAKTRRPVIGPSGTHSPAATPL